jgi:hypothetical protein
MGKKISMVLQIGLESAEGDIATRPDHPGYTYYLSVPDSWAQLSDQELQERSARVAWSMYSDLNDMFHRNEPDDLSSLRVLSILAKPMTTEEEAQKPWLTAGPPAAWEWTPCVAVNEDGSYRKVDPREF